MWFVARAGTVERIPLPFGRRHRQNQVDDGDQASGSEHGPCQGAKSGDPCGEQPEEREKKAHIQKAVGSVPGHVRRLPVARRKEGHARSPGRLRELSLCLALGVRSIMHAT